MSHLRIGHHNTILGFKDRPRPDLDDVLRYGVDQEDAPVFVSERVQLLTEKVLADIGVDAFGQLSTVYL